MKTRSFLIFLCVIGLTQFVSLQGSDIPRLEVLIRKEDPLPESSKGISFSYRDAVKAARKGVVMVTVKYWEDPKGALSLDADASSDSPSEQVGLLPSPTGSGIVLTESGLILTNHHVVAQAKDIRLRADGSTQEISAEIVGADPATDVALLQAEGGAWTPAIFADNTQLEVGDVVLAIGSPYGLENSASLGIVSGTGRSDLQGPMGYLQDFIQTDAAIHPGNSGGPLINGHGHVVGMSTAALGSPNIGLAVPINFALKVAQDFLDVGQVRRGYMGVRLAPLSELSAQQLGLTFKLRGTVVVDVAKGSAAARAGLQPDDIITSLNERPVSSSANLFMHLTQLKAGDQVKLRILRQREVKEVNVVLDELMVADKVSKMWEIIPGLKVEPLDEKLRNKWLLPPRMQALRVVEDFAIQNGEPRVKAGDLILQINGRTVIGNETEENRESLFMLRSQNVMLKIRREGREMMVGINKPVSE